MKDYDGFAAWLPKEGAPMLFGLDRAKPLPEMSPRTRTDIEAEMRHVLREMVRLGREWVRL